MTTTSTEPYEYPSLPILRSDSPLPSNFSSPYAPTPRADAAADAFAGDSRKKLNDRPKPFLSVEAEFVYFAGLLSFSDARQACLNLGDGFDLASIHSAEENAFAFNLFNQTGANAYIGLHKTNIYTDEDEVKTSSNEESGALLYEWTDTTEVDFEYWDRRNSHRSPCVAFVPELSSNSTWSDVSCDWKMGYICGRRQQLSADKDWHTTMTIIVSSGILIVILLLISATKCKWVNSVFKSNIRVQRQSHSRVLTHVESLQESRNANRIMNHLNNLWLETLIGGYETREPPARLPLRQNTPPQEHTNTAAVTICNPCVICFDTEQTHAFLPCGHKCACHTCSNTIYNRVAPKCPICRTPIQSILHVFD